MWVTEVVFCGPPLRGVLVPSSLQGQLSPHARMSATASIYATVTAAVVVIRLLDPGFDQFVGGVGGGD